MTKRSPRIPRSRAPGVTAIVAYDGLRHMEYAIALEVFALVRPMLGVPWYETIVVSPDRGALRGLAGLRAAPTAPFTRIHEARTIVIPGWREDVQHVPATLLDGLRAAARRGARIVSICSGSFVLGQAGLLDGRRATTHWLYADLFRRMFPKATYADDVLYVDEGDIVTSAGCMAGVDACLHVVRKDFGATVANMVARRMVAAPHREGGQAQYVEAPVPSTPERGIGAAMDWARQRLDRSIAVPELAARASMSPRTFFRRFTRQVGMAPNAWLQNERVARARTLLESSDMPLEHIARRCGYDSPETFRSAFKRVTSVSPAHYRRRFLAPA
ncbi:MAG: helix-turn-helix domain-containing protein [Burkholderiales bacterium]